jgi:hypothetical protein
MANKRIILLSDGTGNSAGNVWPHHRVDDVRVARSTAKAISVACASAHKRQGRQKGGLSLIR